MGYRRRRDYFSSQIREGVLKSVSLLQGRQMSSFKDIDHSTYLAPPSPPYRLGRKVEGGFGYTSRVVNIL